MITSTTKFKGVRMALTESEVIYMALYNIKYYFDGQGEVKIEAKNEEEAREKYFEGEWSDEKEWGDTYQIEEVEKL